MDKEKTRLVFESKSNSIDFLYNDDNIAIASIDLMHEDETLEDCNRNLTNFSHDSIVKSLPTFYNKPIIYRLNSEIDKAATDVTSHAKNDKQFSQMKIAGHIPTDARYLFVKRDNGKTYLNMEAIIQKRYLPTLMNILNNREGTLSISIEIDVTDGYQDKDTGIWIINEFTLLGVCLLGENVEPGMEGCHLEMLNFEKQENIQELNKAYINFSLRNNESKEKIEYNNNFEKGGNMEHRELERQLWNILSNKMFTRGKETFHKYYIEAIYDTHIIVRDNEEEELVKLKYHIDKDGKVEIDFTSKKLVEEDLKKFDLSYAKEDIATKEAIKINKKEIKDTPWGQIDKAELRKRVIEAKNFKEIAGEIFLVLKDKWQEGVQSSLKYPVMEIEGNTAYYNRGALSSAKGYAEKNNEQDVLDKLKDIYKSLGLDFEEKEEDSKVMMSCEDSKDVECGDSKDFENVEKDKNENVEKDKEEIEEPHAEAQEDKDNKDKKDDEETRNDDVKREVQMSTDANVDPSAIVEIEKRQAEDNKDLSEDANPSVANLDLMKEIEGLKLELEELRTYKNNVENEKKEYEVNSLINSVKDILPEEIKNECIEKSKNYSLSNIGEWENMVKAKAFEYSDRNKTNVAPKYTKMTIWGNQEETKPKSKGLWDGLI